MILPLTLKRITSATILYFLETCPYPFGTPKCLPIRRKAVRRISSFGDDMLSQSISRACSFGIDDEEKHQEDLERIHETMNYPQIIKRTLVENSLSMPEAFPKAMLSRSSSSYSSSDWTDISGSLASSEFGRKITPSSSISNMSRRSPLSTMRSVDHPDVVIRPALRYIPPQYPLMHNLSAPLLEFSTPSALTGPSVWDLTAPVLPTVHRELGPRHSLLTVPSLSLHKARSYESIRAASSYRSKLGEAKISVRGVLPPPPAAKAVRIVKKKTVDVNIPRAFHDPYSEQVEEHSRKIFAEIDSGRRWSSETRSTDAGGIRSLRKMSVVQLQRKPSWDV